MSLMKTCDISQTQLVRRYGVRGAKLFARLWFPLLYCALICLAGALCFVGPEVVGSRRIVMAGISGTLVVFATFLLTRMHCNYLAAIERLQQSAGRP
jgi:hypothetical protein